MKFWLNPEYKPGFELARLATKHYSKSFYLSAKMLPPETRWATYALYGFCRYADNLIDKPRNRSFTNLLQEVDHLTWEINQAYETGSSEHPVIQPFIVVAKKYNIPAKYPLELIRGVKMDIEKSRYENFDELYLFAYRVAGVVGLMMTHVLGFKSDKAFEHAEKLGIAMQLTNILRDIQEDKEMGRIYLPQDELRSWGISDADILNEKMCDKMHKFMQFQVKRAHHFYEEGNKGIHLLDRKSQFAIYAASKIYRGILRRIEARDLNPYKGRVFVPQLRKIGILFSEIIRTRFLPKNFNSQNFYFLLNKPI
ncbi:MAG: phytoene/squalene synthase family protein [Deferribacteres bacterium]|nr:phytoene/squalene synthase family protein [candidate division KSB1 bacterium]MCB9504073.1 phytoene/squalene synthase family protein [Deferribacteres bacterium]